MGFHMWMVPQLSLPTQLRQERDRRIAAHMTRDELAIKVDEMIKSWYLQHELIDRLLGEVRALEVKVAIGEPVPTRNEISAEHLAWANELMGR